MTGRLVAAVPGWVKLALIAGSGAALMTAGAAAWDRMPVVGPHAKITGLRAELATTNKTLWQRTGEREAWKARAGNCEDARRKERDLQAGNVTTGEADKSNASSAAFDSGYAAGRAVGRKQCEVKTDASQPNPSGGPVPVPGRVSDDDVAAWNASRYQPGAALPR